MSLDPHAHAFPINWADNDYPLGTGGLTLRQWFAGQALAAVSCGIIAERDHSNRQTKPADALAAAAVEIADAMLIALAKQ